MRVKNTNQSTTDISWDCPKKNFQKIQLSENQSVYYPGPAHYSSSYPLDFQTVLLSVLQLFKESAEFVTGDVLSKLGQQEVVGSALIYSLNDSYLNL